MKLQIILEPSDEGRYTVYVPALPGCISEGDNVDEAMENIKEAIELYLEPIERHCIEPKFNRSRIGYMSKVPSLSYKKVIAALKRDVGIRIIGIAIYVRWRNS